MGVDGPDEPQGAELGADNRDSVLRHRHLLDLLGLSGGSAGSISAAFAIVIWLVGLGAVIMLWRRESTAYFKRDQMMLQ